MTTSNHGRTPLPCGQFFGRRYACCHRDETRTWLTIQVRCVDASLNAVTSISIKHPLCCQQGWAVSCLHMGIRRILRTALKEQALFRDTDNHVRSLLFSHLAKPEYASYWELAHELSEERRQRRQDRSAAEQRRRAAEAFVERGRYADDSLERQDVLPAHFHALGFTSWPRSEAEITRRYRELALATHPDFGGDVLDFKRIDTAYHLAIRSYDRRSKRPQ